MAKVKDNEAMLKDFIKNTDSMNLAVTRAILVDSAEQVLADTEAIRRQYSGGLISADLIIRQAEDVIKYLGFEGDK